MRPVGCQQENRRPAARRSLAQSCSAIALPALSAKRPEPGAHVFRQQLRLLHRSKCPPRGISARVQTICRSQNHPLSYPRLQTH